MVVNRQVEVCFKIGRYDDVVLCDVVPMEACHLLLGRPWQFDNKVCHEGYSNKYSFVHHGRKIVLVPLKPSEVREDQKKMREKNEQERKEKEKKEKEIIVKERDKKESHEEVIEKTEVNEREKEKSVKSWLATTLVPSSKLVCVVKCWDSFNIISFSNMSSFYDEGNKMKEEIIEKENVSFTFCALEVMLDSLSQRELIKEKRNSTFERKQWVKRKTYFSNLNENFSKVKFTCDGFFRFIFDPGGFRTTNSRSNSLEEGGNDVILI
jgi:hypothetical protein